LRNQTKHTQREEKGGGRQREGLFEVLEDNYIDVVFCEGVVESVVLGDLFELVHSAIHG
jgi:hypothetical protein